VAALVGIALSYAAVMAGAAGAGASDGRNEGALCTLGADACRLTAPVLPSAAEAPVYATPAEVDCRAVILINNRGTDSGGRGFGRATDRLPLSGDCEPAPLDLRYRVSRFPDSERPSGALRSERSRRAVGSAPVATGLPPESGTVPTTAAQPMALYAAHDLAPPAVRDLDIQAPTPLDTRGLDPPDRPPRV